MSSVVIQFPSTLRWLYVDFNSYFASVEQQEQPRLRGKPVAVVPVETDATCAIAASYEAKALGIKTGTPIYEAKKLCPDLICVLARHEYYVDYHHRICEEIERHIPVSAVCSIDEMACQLMKNEASVEVATRIALNIKQGIAKNIGEHVRCSIGIAPNRYLAKVATELQKPDGLQIIQQHELPHRLHDLKLRDLPGIGHNMELRLHKNGVRSLQQVLALDAKQMRQIWGSIWGERMYYLLRGRDLSELETNRTTVGHSHVLAPELRAPDKARNVARRLTVKAASRLRRMEYTATSLTLSVRVDKGARLALEARCVKAQDNTTFLNMLNALWKYIMQQANYAPIKKVSVTLHGLSPVKNDQMELFDVVNTEEIQKHQKAESLSREMDKLNKKYGRDTVSIGLLPSQGRSFSGTKIAFTRIPDKQEFKE